jgi:hypothetical protein
MVLDTNTQVKTQNLKQTFVNYSSNFLKYENYVFSSLKETRKSNYGDTEPHVTSPNIFMFLGINSDLLYRS